MADEPTEPSDWQLLIDDKEGRDRFVTAYKDAIEWLNLVQ